MPRDLGLSFDSCALRRAGTPRVRCAFQRPMVFPKDSRPGSPLDDRHRAVAPVIGAAVRACSDARPG
jgi:hypothetical protein